MEEKINTLKINLSKINKGKGMTKKCAIPELQFEKRDYDILNQIMVFGRVFYHDIKTKFGMSSLVALVDAQEWMYLFESIGIAYVSEVKDFNNDLMFT